MTWLASIQQVNDEGAIQPLPDEPDVIEVMGTDAFDVGYKIARVIQRFQEVRDFDLTITNQDVPFDDGPPPRHRVHPNADENRSRGITAL